MCGARVVDDLARPRPLYKLEHQLSVTLSAILLLPLHAMISKAGYCSNSDSASSCVHCTMQTHFAFTHATRHDLLTLGMLCDMVKTW